MSNIINPVELTSALIKCRSITPISAGSIDLIISYLEPMGFICTKIDFGQGSEKVENLYARLGFLEPNICFAGHVDVVPIGDKKSWSINPFGGEIKEGKIWGRGAADMKSGIAAFIAAVSEFKEMKNIDRGTMMRIVEDVFRSTLKRKYGSDENVDVIVNPDKGDLEIWLNREIVPDEEVEDLSLIHI